MGRPSSQMRGACLALLLYIVAPAIAFAVPVLKVDGAQTMMAIPHGAKRKWAIGETMCVRQGGRDVACGKVTKTTTKGAIVKFDTQTGEAIANGDEVVFRKGAADTAAAEVGPESSLEKPSAPAVPVPPPSVPIKKAARLAEEDDEKDLQKLQDGDFSKSEPESLEKPTAEPDPVEPEAPKKSAQKKSGVEEEVVDLDAESTAAETKATAPANPHGSRLGVRPKFKALFDWWLTHQPGRNTNGVSVSFESYHYLMILEIAPDPRFYFGFEVSQNPRFYELDYQITKRITIRAGRIYIPFDDLSPHSYFGGRANVTRISQPGTNTAFLPDLWTDLGVGVKIGLVSSGETNLDLNAYVVNGFGEGTSPGSDTVYPDFSTTNLQDNNSAKSLGARLQLSLLGDTVVFGGSTYYGRYSNQASPEAAILMAGVDSRIKLNNTELRGGYVFMNVGVVPSNSFVRGAFYLELAQYFGNWRVLARMGQSQNDSRIVQLTDQTLAGAQIAYRAGPVQVSVEHSRDLNDVVGKTYRSFSGLRVGLMF